MRSSFQESTHRNNQPIHSTCFALSRDIQKAITQNESRFQMARTARGRK